MWYHSQNKYSVSNEGEIMDDVRCVNTSCKITEPLSKTETTIGNLRVLMSRAEGQDKCILCEAARLLEEKYRQNNSSWFSPMFMLLMTCMLDNNSMVDFDKIARAYAKSCDKVKEEEKEKKQSKNGDVGFGKISVDLNKMSDLTLS